MILFRFCVINSVMEYTLMKGNALFKEEIKKLLKKRQGKKKTYISHSHIKKTKCSLFISSFHV